MELTRELQSDDIIRGVEVEVYVGEGIRLRTHQRKKIGDQPLTLTSMHNMLSNIFYIGRFTYVGKEYNEKHSSIVNEKHLSVSRRF